MTKNLELGLIGTQANVEANSKLFEGLFGYVTDLNAIGAYDGSDWTWIALADGVNQFAAATKIDVSSATALVVETGGNKTLVVDTANGSVIIDVNLTTGFLIKNTTGGAANVLVVDTVNRRCGISVLPTYTFDVNSAAANVVARFASTDPFAQILLEDDTSTDAELIRRQGDKTDLFAGGTRHLRCVGNSHVLINTTSDLGQLHIDQSSASGAIPSLFLDQGDVSEQCIIFSSDAVDRDINLLDVNVTGTPRMMWDESLDIFHISKGLATEGNYVLPKASGFGIKVDTTTPTFGWQDLLGDVFARNTGASKPAFNIYRDTLRDYQFAAGDEEYFKVHIPHDYVAGTNIFLHFHWSHTATTVTGGTVTFEYEASYAKGHNQAAFPASVSGTLTGTPSTTQYQQIISEIQLSASTPSGSQLDTDDLEPDGVIIMRGGLNANNLTVSGGGVPDPFIHYVDIHYQSTNIGTKDKVPDFYA